LKVCQIDWSDLRHVPFSMKNSLRHVTSAMKTLCTRLENNPCDASERPTQTRGIMALDPLIPCNFSHEKLSFYIPSDFSLPVLERYGPATKTILFGVIPPNARFPVTRRVLGTLVEYADLLPNLECIFSCSGRVADDVTDDDVIRLVRAFRGLKSIYLDGFKGLTDRTFIAILYACPDIEDIIVSAGSQNEGFLTQKSLGAFFAQPRVGTKVKRVELLHQAPNAFTDDIILPLSYEFLTLSREFKFWKTAPGSWESWMLPEPGEVERDEAQRKIAFGPGWFRKKNANEQLKVFESWQNCRSLKQVVARISSSPLKESANAGDKKDTSAKPKSQWKGSIRKKMLGGML